MALEVLIHEDAIRERVADLGRRISADYAGKTVHLVCVLKGAYPFLADLARSIDLPVTIDFLAVSSYGKGTRTSGEVRLTKRVDLKLRHGLARFLDDIFLPGLQLPEEVGPVQVAHELFVIGRAIVFGENDAVERNRLTAVQVDKSSSH